MSKQKGITKGKEQFLDKLLPVIKRLPKSYGTFYAHEFLQKEKNKRAALKRVYNVYNAITVDWEILENLKHIADVYGKKSK